MCWLNNYVFQILPAMFPFYYLRGNHVWPKCLSGEWTELRRKCNLSNTKGLEWLICKYDNIDFLYVAKASHLQIRSNLQRLGNIQQWFIRLLRETPEHRPSLSILRHIDTQTHTRTPHKAILHYTQIYLLNSVSQWRGLISKFVNELLCFSPKLSDVIINLFS